MRIVNVDPHSNFMEKPRPFRLWVCALCAADFEESEAFRDEGTLYCVRFFCTNLASRYVWLKVVPE